MTSDAGVEAVCLALVDARVTSSAVLIEGKAALAGEATAAASQREVDQAVSDVCDAYTVLGRTEVVTDWTTNANTVDDFLAVGLDKCV